MNAISNFTREQLNTILALCPNPALFGEVHIDSSEDRAECDFDINENGITIWNPAYTVEFQHAMYEAWARVLQRAMPIESDLFKLATYANWEEYVVQFLKNTDAIPALLEQDAPAWLAVLEAICKSIERVQGDRTPRQENLLLIASYLKEQAVVPAEKKILSDYRLGPSNRQALLLVHRLPASALVNMPIEELDFSWHFADDLIVSKLKYLPKLRVLNLRGTAITGEAMTDAPYFSVLQELDLSSTAADDYTLNCLMRCQTLRKLIITGTPAAKFNIELPNVEVIS